MNVVRSRAVHTIAVLAVLALVSAACGSTAKKGAISNETTDAADVGDSAAAAPGKQAQAKGSTSKGRTSGSVSSVLGPQKPGAPASGIVTSRRLRVAAGTPGVTDRYIYVGVPYTKNQGAANAAIGVQGVDQGDGRKPFLVVANDINAHGGLAGRKIKPIFHGYDATSTQTSDEQDEAACATYTQDNKTFAIFSSGDIIDECARKEGAIQFGSGAFPETFKKYPHRIDINGLNRIRLSTRTIEGLYGRGFFEKGAKIGLVTWDDPHYHAAVERGFVPALRKRGLKLGIETAYVKSPQNLQDTGATSADINSAVLRFKTNDVSHVMILDGASGVCLGGCITIIWMRQADAQRYYPRYGFNDTNTAKEVYNLKLMTAQQAHRSIYVSWIDLDDSYDEGWHPNRSRKRCEELQRKHGTDMSNVNAHATAIGACTDLWFLQLGVKGLTSVLGADAFIGSVNRLGYSFTSPLAYYNFFGPARHDGNAGERIMVFQDGCSCFKYVTKPYKI